MGSGVPHRNENIYHEVDEIISAVEKKKQEKIIADKKTFVCDNNCDTCDRRVGCNITIKKRTLANKK